MIVDLLILILVYESSAAYDKGDPTSILFSHIPLYVVSYNLSKEKGNWLETNVCRESIEEIDLCFST